MSDEEVALYLECDYVVDFKVVIEYWANRELLLWKEENGKQINGINETNNR